MAVLEHQAQQQRLEAYHKIPTTFLAELNQLLTQNHITQ
jgi:hypothetical protein